MKGLQRLSRPAGASAPQPLVGSSPPGGHGDLYLPLDPGDMSVVPLPEETWGHRGGVRRPHSCCFDTNGRAFNFVVGIVVLASSVLVGLEADLGLLGPAASMRWGSLDADLGQFSVPPEEAQLLRSELLRGVAEDQALQARLRGEAAEDLGRFGVHGVGVPEVPEPLAPAAYSVCEYAFVAFFTVELLLRMCDQRRAFFCSPWSVLDAAVVAQGLLDAVLPLVCGPDPSPAMLDAMSFLRILRVLRVARLLRVCLALRVLARAFVSAFSAMAWISAVVLILNFVLAILLTVFVGQNAAMWEAKADEVNLWFGSICKSMQTLFLVMTLSGWEDIAAVLSEVYPPASVSVAFVLYVMVSFFTVLSLTTGVVTDSFMTAQRDEEAFRRAQLEEHRTAFASALASVLSSCTQSRRGYLCRDEYCAALEAHPVLLSKLRRIDIHTSADDLLQLFDRVAQESDLEGSVRIGVLVEAMTNISGAARSSNLLDVKYSVQAMRREATDQAAGCRSEAVRRHEEVMGNFATAQEVADALREVAEAGRREAAAARQAAAACVERFSSVASVATVAQKVEELGRRVEAAEVRSSENFEAVNRKLETLSAQVLSQLAMLGSKVADGSASTSATTSLVTHPKEEPEGQPPADECEADGGALRQEPGPPPAREAEAAAVEALAGEAAPVTPDGALAGAPPWEASFPAEAQPAQPSAPSEPPRAPSEPESTPPGRDASLENLLEAEPPESATPAPAPAKASAWASATPERRGSADKQELKDMMDLSANEIFDKLVKQDTGDTFS